MPEDNGPRIVFMGTPEFAVASLDAILRAGYTVVAVITAPDKPAGRGMQLTGSAVKKIRPRKGIDDPPAGKIKEPRLPRRAAGPPGRPADRSGVPHAAGSRMEHAPHGHG